MSAETNSNDVAADHIQELSKIKEVRPHSRPIPREN